MSEGAEVVDEDDSGAAKPTAWNRAAGPEGETRSIPDPVARRVWIAAGGRCTFCGKNLLIDEVTGEEVSIGQLAHIVGWSTASGSPRGDDGLPPGERNTADNLMLMCYDQHRVIDARTMWEIYDVETLRDFKRQHEETIRRLTALRDDRSSTVLRVVSSIGTRPVVVSRRTTAQALLDRGLFPDYALLGFDAEFEVDLRSIDDLGVNTPAYWQAGQSIIQHAAKRVRALAASEDLTRLSILALARIPMLIALGVELGEGIPIDLYPTRRSGEEGFGWTPSRPEGEFEFRRVQEGDGEDKVAVLLSLSGKVAADRAVTLDEHYTIYELVVTSMDTGAEVICSRDSLDNFVSCWRGLLAHLEAQHSGLDSLAVFPALPVTAAIALGRALMRGAHPALDVYDLIDGTYQFALRAERP